MKKLIVILILALVVFPAYTQETPQPFQDINQDDLGNAPSEFQEYFFEALKQKGIENYEKAINALQKCLELNSNKAIVFFELGKNYRKLGNYEAAVENLQNAQQLEPKKESILVYLLETHRQQANFSEAITASEKLVLLDDSYKEELAGLYTLNEEYDKALEILDAMDTKLGNSSYRNSLRRQIYTRTNNTTAQIGNLQQSIDENPENEQNYLNLIYIYSQQGNEEKAYEIAQELAQSNPGSSLVHLALYKFYLNKANPEEAVKSMKIVFESEEIDAESKFKVLNDFLNFVETNPAWEDELLTVSKQLSQLENAPKLYEQLGKYYLSKNKTEDALKFFEIGLVEEPDNFELVKNTLLLQLDFEKYVEAKELSSTSLEIFPSQPTIYLLKGAVLNKLEEYQSAAETLLEGMDYIIEDKKLEADFYSQLATSYKGLKNLSKAEEYSQKAKQLIKDFN